MESERRMQKNENHIVVKALVKAKRKEEKAEKTVIRAGILCLCVLALAVFYMITAVFLSHHSSQYWTVMIHDPVMIILIAVLVYTFANLKNKKKSQDKAERDFDRLREDVIDRSSDIWQLQHSTADRETYYQHLMKEHNINLYHK
ncbi:DUF2663 family protein [Alteribacter keqinensis]|uniref:DUF2663 family protein n=1 Tax=Alteribacter keqinensis TaxID=2483800 RepID=A0A3M7TTZ7_9BACI|nr:DUF2663 family protein [Alteribacter keqinensis]RNA69108.1 DUF2663 family protein [Alteribacter keqinensis]